MYPENFNEYWFDKWTGDAAEYERIRVEATEGKLIRQLFAGKYGQLIETHQAFLSYVGLPEKICHFLSQVERCHYMVSKTSDGLLFVYVAGGDSGCLCVYPKNQQQWIEIRDAVAERVKDPKLRRKLLRI